LPGTLDEDSLHRYDVVKLEAHLSVNPDSHIVAGYELLRLTTNEIPMADIDLRLVASLTIDSVWSVGDARQVTVAVVGQDSIRFQLVPSLAVGDTTTLGIAYHGVPSEVDPWGGFHWEGQNGDRPPVHFSMGEGLNIDPPPSNFNWLPSYADPTDKTLWEGWFTVPANRVAVSNGLRLDTVRHANTVTWHYQQNQPVSTYLISIAISDYRIMVQRDSLPRIENFVYPAYVTRAQTHFSNVPAVLDGFAQLFAPFPFDRFGYAQTRNGDMEHVTCVSHADFTVQANHQSDWLLFHEMAHQWWGDWVTCADWENLWLNEGFGTYCEALSMEILYGRESYNTYVTNNIFASVLTSRENFPIYNPEYYWGTTVYEKGACVMHMLRQVLGDSAFFEAWRDYGQQHAFGTAVTADWQATLEAHYGSSLDWFFQPWVYGVHFPDYMVTLDMGDIIVLRIDQLQAPGTLFRMPIDVRIVSTDNDTSEFTVWNDAVDTQSWMIVPNDSIQVTGWPREIEIDPYNKILKTVGYEILGANPAPPVLPSDFRIQAVYPNPFNPATTVSFTLPRSSTARLSVFDLTGRLVNRMELGSLSAGDHSVRWDGSQFSSGVYLFQLETQTACRIAKAVLLK
jgi:aminopeptidase N